MLQFVIYYCPVILLCLSLHEDDNIQELDTVTMTHAHHSRNIVFFFFLILNYDFTYVMSAFHFLQIKELNSYVALRKT